MSKTAVIMNTYIKSPMIAHMTMASLAAIRKFTGEPYELIVIDNEPEFPIRDEYDVLRIDKYVRNDEDIGCYSSYNVGAQIASDDVDCYAFIQSDVFVHEGWLKGLRQYIDNGLAEAVFPDQVPRNREYVIESYEVPYDHPKAMAGGRDAGLLFITKEAFKRTGGWPDGIKSAVLAEKYMYAKMGDAKVNWIDTRKVIITHIMAATNLVRLHEDPDDYNKQTTEEEAYGAI